MAAYIEQKRAEQAARAVVTDTRPEQEPIDEDPSPVLAESTLAPAPTTAAPLPATPLPTTPLPTAPTIPTPRRTGTNVGIVAAIVVSCVVLVIIGGLCVVWYNASKTGARKKTKDFRESNRILGFF